MKSLFNRSAAAVVAAAFSVGTPGLTVAQMPGMPASPLAGGQAAATGQAFIDAHGNPIVLPTSYGQPCGPYGAYDGACPEACGYGGEGYADFGGCPYPDQSGPHYFDVAVMGVGLMAEDMFQDVPDLVSVGAGGPTLLNPQQAFDDYEAGWQIMARLDFGPLSVLEATYMGVYDFGGTETVRSVDVDPMGGDFQLFTVFSDFGVPVAIEGLDDASVITLDYQSDLQSTELSYRRYWVGYSPLVSGTYLAGFRYIRMTEELNFNSQAFAGNSNLNWDAQNDLVGAQLGGDGWITLRQGLRIGGEAKAGIYNNRFEFSSVTNIPDPDVTNVDFAEDGNQLAFAGESTFDVVADILPSFSIRAGYRVLYLNSLVTVGNNIDVETFIPPELLTQADALYHGFHGGLEYIW